MTTLSDIIDKYQHLYGYQAVKEFYGDNTAKRSGVPLMNHIVEGMAILSLLDADDATVEAYCLHPLLQNYADLVKFYKEVKAESLVMLLTMEYRNKANSYLCYDKTDNITVDDLPRVVGKMLPEVRLMLIADKIQNQKDFLKYHLGTHARSKELQNYFENWIKHLNPEPTIISNFYSMIDNS